MEVTAMTQESALTSEEIEAMDEDLGTPGRTTTATRPDAEAAAEQVAVRSQEPEAKS